MHPLDVQIAALAAQDGPDARLELIWSYYESATGVSLNRPPSNKQRDAVRAYLQSMRVTDDWPSLMAKRQQTTQRASLTLAEKASSLVQATCPTCEILVGEDGRAPLALKVPINVEPWSSQSRKDRVRIRETVSAEMAKHPWMYAYDGPTCVTVVSVLAKGSKSKDADNLTKGLLDSLQKVLYKNDRTIQCLTSRVVRYRGSVGYYLVSARAVHPWMDDVVSPADTRDALILANRINC